MTNKISDKDKKDWKKFITSEEKVIDKDSKSNLKTRQKNKYIDLHGYTLEAANKKIEKIIIESFLEKIKKITVVTGKGLHSENEKNPYVSKDLSILIHMGFFHFENATPFQLLQLFFLFFLHMTLL